MNEKNRSIGLLGAISIGIGGMVGGGIFAVLGEAVSLAHGATAVAFFFAGIVALLTAYSYAKLSVTYQSRGGTIVFIDKAFGHNLLSGSANVMLWLSYLITISLYAVAFASYAQTFFSHDSKWLKHLLISVAILLPLVINLISASFVSRSETLFVVLKLLILFLIIFTSAFYIDMERLSPTQWGSGFSILVAGMIIFVAYEGFELIANAAEDVKHPKTTLPRAFYGSVILVIVLYILIAIITTGSVPESQLLTAKDYALAVAAKPALGQLGFTMVAIAALLATLSAINATIYGNARLGFILAKKGDLPKKLAIENHRHIPTLDVIVTATLSLMLANSIDLTEIAIIGSASFLLIFFIVNIAAYQLRLTIQANPVIIFIASLVSGSALITLLIHTFENNPRAIVIFIAFIAISILFELLYGTIIRKHLFQRSYIPKK
ncbi:cationic amino acid transporter (cat-2) [hydrothermal vent metagenome]|uniref:Cationic amino acid transporter (Cat-2) n=1 Tax=hydrothermal vent metagenome TaxID=652676 RepID=A0A3B0WVL9_9ZZZZ